MADAERFAVNTFNGSLFGKRDVEKLQEIISYRSVFLEQRCIMVDEIDGATMSAQRALRALIETGDASWIFAANDLGKIMPALRSRVILIDCSYATPAKRKAHLVGIARRCRVILSAEGVRDFSDEEVRHVVGLHYPDMRQTINALQLKCATQYAA